MNNYFDRDFLYANLTNGITYQQYLDENQFFINERLSIYEDIVISTSMTVQERVKLTSQTIKEIIPQKEMFVNEDDYNEVYKTTLLSFADVLDGASA